MKKTISASFLLLLCLLPFQLLAQGKSRRPKPAGSSANATANQWWIGIRGGVNFSSANSEKTYSVYSFTQAASEGFDEKQYNAYTLPGLQFGFSASYEFIKGLSVNLLPSYASYRFSYDNSFLWYNTEDPESYVSTTYTIESRLQYIELPLTFKYELTSGKFKPYIQAGAYYSFLTDALKQAESKNTDRASGSDTEINVTNLSVGINDRTKKGNYGLIGGVGFTYNLGNARVGLEINYMYGLQNIDNGEMKFADSQLVTGAYDVPDDYSMDNIGVSLQVIIPLKFITSKDYVPL